MKDRHATIIENDGLATREAQRARHLTGRWADIDDFKQDARVGLIKAIDGHIVTKNKLSTYAHRKCRGQIMDCVAQLVSEVRLPKYLAMKRHGRHNPDLAKKGDAAKRAKRLPLTDVCDTRVSHETEVEDAEVVAILMAEIGLLDPRMQQIVIHRFGIGCEAKSQEEVGSIVSMCASSVGRIERQAIAIIAKRMARTRGEKE